MKKLFTFKIMILKLHAATTAPEVSMAVLLDRLFNKAVFST